MISFAAAAFAAVAVAAGCAATPGIRAAESGDFAALRAEIGAGEKAGTLSLGDARAMARAIASRELSVALPEAAFARVREVRACALDVDDALRQRMKTPDAAGAEAALARLESGQLDGDDARKFIASADDRWRAVGARALTRLEDGAARLRALVDASPFVRRSAVRAAVAAKDPKDIDAVNDAARLDPEPMVRTEAVRTMALVATGVDVATRLRDLWAGADDAIREDIAGAWAMPAVFPRGGRDALRVVLASEQGPGVLAAAGAVMRAVQAGQSHDSELETLARADLARAIDASSPRNRLHAIAVAPLGKTANEETSSASSVMAALRRASHDDDKDVRIAALARMVEPSSDPERSADRAEATRQLEALAGQTENAMLASRARLALAHAGDARIQAWVEADLAAPDPEMRLAAVDALAALGRASRGAPLLADADSSVRTRAACALPIAARVAAR